MSNSLRRTSTHEIIQSLEREIFEEREHVARLTSEGESEKNRTNRALKDLVRVYPYY